MFTKQTAFIYCLILTSFFFSLNATQTVPYIPSPKEPLLCLTTANNDVLPRNFRKANDPFPSDKDTDEPLPSRAGMDALRVSGSAQFSEKALRKICEVLPREHLIIVDLREESHGFINGHAVAWRGENDWGNIYKSDDEIIADENKRLETILIENKQAVLSDKDDATRTTVIDVESVQNESDLLASMGIDYHRITITNHIRPNDADVDAFVAFIRSLPADAWIHFHCAAGKGRTGTFLTMIDIMHNAKQVTLNDIFRRQALIGGLNFLAHPNPNSWKYYLNCDRILLLRYFYRYCKETEDFKIPWSAWIKSKTEH